MEYNKIIESSKVALAHPTESREFPEPKKEKQFISLFGSQGECYALKNGMLYESDSFGNEMNLIAKNVQSVAGGIKCYAYADNDGKAYFFENGNKSDVFDKFSDIRYVVSDGKEKFYLIDSSGQAYCFNTKAERSRKMFDKEIVSFEDYTDMISTVSQKEIQQLKSKGWAEYWVKNTEYYKKAAEQYGEENIGFKVYDSNKTVLDNSANYKVIVSVSFSVFTVRDESIPPVVRSEEKIYIPEKNETVYIDNAMYTDASDTELFINCPVKKAVYIAGVTAAERYSAFSSVRVVVNTITKKPRIINKGLMLQEDGTLQVFDPSSHSWKNTSFPIRNICDIALCGKENAYAVVSKTNGEIIITQYSTLLKYESTGSINIIRML